MRFSPTGQWFLCQGAGFAGRMWGLYPGELIYLQLNKLAAKRARWGDFGLCLESPIYKPLGEMGSFPCQVQVILGFPFYSLQELGHLLLFDPCQNSVLNQLSWPFCWHLYHQFSLLPFGRRALYKAQTGRVLLPQVLAIKKTNHCTCLSRFLFYRGHSMAMW